MRQEYIGPFRILEVKEDEGGIAMLDFSHRPNMMRAKIHPWFRTSLLRRGPDSLDMSFHDGDLIIPEEDQLTMVFPEKRVTENVGTSSVVDNTQDKAVSFQEVPQIIPEVIVQPEVIPSIPVVKTLTESIRKDFHTVDEILERIVNEDGS